jgi:hypothetical protein
MKKETGAVSETLLLETTWRTTQSKILAKIFVFRLQVEMGLNFGP